MKGLPRKGVFDGCNDDYTPIKFNKLDAICRKYNSHPQDIIWDVELKPLPYHHNEIYPLLDELKKRNLRLRTLVAKTRKFKMYANYHIPGRLSTYDICSFAYLLDMDPVDLVRMDE